MHPQIEKLLARYPVLAPCGDDIQKAVDALAETYRSGGKLLLCGNGGSAADADHIAGELLKGFCSKRPLKADARERLGEELASKLQDALPAISLHSLGAINTAWLNDCDPYYGYAQLVWASATQTTPSSEFPLPETLRMFAMPWKSPTPRV